MQWLKPIIPAFRRLRQGDCNDSEAVLGYKVDTYIHTYMHMHMHTHTQDHLSGHLMSQQMAPKRVMLSPYA